MKFTSSIIITCYENGIKRTPYIQPSPISCLAGDLQEAIDKLSGIAKKLLEKDNIVDVQITVPRKEEPTPKFQNILIVTEGVDIPGKTWEGKDAKKNAHIARDNFNNAARMNGCPWECKTKDLTDYTGYY